MGMGKLACLGRVIDAMANVYCWATMAFMLFGATQQ